MLLRFHTKHFAERVIELYKLLSTDDQHTVLYL